MKGYFNVQKWELGEKTTKYAAMVRDGEMGREVAPARAEKEETRNIDPVIAEFKKRLSPTTEDLLVARNKTRLGFL